MSGQGIEEQQITVVNFSGLTVEEGLSGMQGPLVVMDASDIAGTNGYCDGASEDELNRRLTAAGVTFRGIHLIDHGSYHYMSKLLTERIRQNYTLLVYDHHTDMQPPAFGGLLSCGGWILEALRTQQYLREVMVIGADPDYIRETGDYLQEEEDHEALLSRIRFASAPVPLSEIRWPVYLSIDLDVLAPEEIMTSWDQGTLSLERLLADIESLRQHGALLGTDICGGPAPAQRQTPDGPVQLTRCYEVYARIVQALRA